MLLEETLTIPLRIMFAAMVVALIVGLIAWDGKVNAVYANTTALDAYVLRMTNEASSATAMFVPPNDPVDGSANADGHAFELLQRDAQRNDSFLIYRFDAASHAMQRYTSSAIDGTVQAAGAPYTGIAAFHIALAHAHELNRPWFTRAIADQEFNMGYPGVVAGNVRLKGIIVDASGFWRDLRFFSGTNPSQMNIVTAVYTPAPDPIVATPATLSLDPGDTAALSVTESSAKYYTGSFFLAPQQGCGGVVSLVGPTHGATPLAPSTIAVTATASGACTLQITDQVANPPLDVPVQVRGPVVVDPVQLAYHGIHDANPVGTHPDGTTFADAGGNVRISQGYGGPFVATPDANCPAVLGISAPLSVPGPSSAMPAFQPLAIGTCTFSVATTVGRASPVQLAVQVLPAALVVTPQTVTIAHQTDTNAPQSIAVSEVDYADTFDIDASDCTNRHVAIPANAVAVANPGTFTIAPDPTLKGGTATCVVAVFDHATNPEGSPGAKSVAVTVGDAVCTQTGAAKDAPMVVNGQNYISTGIDCGQYNYVLGGAVAVQFTQTGLSGPDQTAVDACAAAGTVVCALPDGAYYCTNGAGFNLAACVLTEFGGNPSVASNVTTGNQGAQSYPGDCTDFQSLTGCSTIFAGGNGNGGTPPASPLPVIPPTLVDIYSADAEQTWSDCFISSTTSSYPPNANATDVYNFDRTSWPLSAQIAQSNFTVKVAAGLCPAWTPQ